MRIGWGAGALIAFLLSVALFFFGLVTLPQMVSLILLLVGLWSIGASFTVVERKDRTYYAGWGVIMAVLSLFAFIPARYTIALLLVALVALILLYGYGAKTGKIFTAATSPPSPSGRAPAARAN